MQPQHSPFLKPITQILVILLVAAFFFFGLSRLLFSWGALPTALEAGIEKGLAASGLTVEIDQIRPGIGSNLEIVGVQLSLPDQAGEANVEKVSVHYSWIKLLRNFKNPVQAISRIKIINPTVFFNASSGIDLISTEGSGKPSLPSLAVEVSGGDFTLVQIPTELWGTSPALHQVIEAISLDLSAGHVVFKNVAANLVVDSTGRIGAVVQGVPAETNLQNFNFQVKVDPETGWSARVSSDNAEATGFAPLLTKLQPGLDITEGRLSATAYFASRPGSTVTWSTDLWIHRLNGSLSTFGLDFTNLQGGVRITPDLINLTGLRVNLGQDTVELSGLIKLGTPGSLNLKAVTNRLDLAEYQELWKNWRPTQSLTEVAGRASAALTISGTLEEPLLAGKIDLVNVQAQIEQAYPIELANLAGEVGFAGQRVWTDKLDFRLAEQPLRLSGEVLLGDVPYFDLNLSTRQVGLDRLVTWLEARGLSRFIPASLRSNGVTPLHGDLSFSGTFLGTIEAPLVAGKLGLNNGAVGGMPVDSLAVDFDYASTVLNLGRIDLLLPQNQKIHGSMQWLFGSERLEYSGVYRYNQLDLEWIALQLPNLLGQLAQVGGEASGELLIQGELGQGFPAIIGGSTRIANPVLWQNLFQEIKADWSWDQGLLDLTYAEAETQLGSFSGSGNLQWTPDQAVIAQVFGHDLDLVSLGRWLAQAGISIPELQTVEGKGSFQAAVAGTLTDPRVSGKLLVTDPAWHGEKLDLLTASFVYSDAILSIEKAEVLQGIARVAVTGQVNVGQQSPRFYLKTAVQDIDMARINRIFGLNLPLSGVLNANFNFDGSWPQLVLRGPVSLEDGMLLDLPLDAVRGELSLTKDRIEFSQVTAEIAGAQVRTNGVWENKKLAAVLQVDNVDLAILDNFVLLPNQTGVQGQGSFSGLLSGSWTDLVLEGTIDVKDLAYQDYHLNRAKGKVRYGLAQHLLSLDSFRLYQNASIVKVIGEVSLADHFRYNLNLDLDNVTLADLAQVTANLAWPEINGELSGFVQLNGTGPKFSGRSLLQCRQLQYGDLQYDAELDFSYTNGSVTLHRGRLWDQTGQVTVLGTYGEDGSLQFSVNGKKVAIQPLITIFRPGLSIAGKANFNLELSGEIADPRAVATFSVEEGLAQGVNIDNLTGKMIFDKMGVAVQEAVATTGANKTIVSGLIPWRKTAQQQDLNIRVQMADDSLALLGLVLGQDLDVKGQGKIDLTFSGNLANPLINGSVDLTGLHLAAPQLFPGVFDQVTFNMNFQGREGVIRKATGVYNGGRFNLQGKLGLAQGKNVDVALNLNTVGVRLDLGYLQAKTDAVLNISGPLVEPLVKGKAVLTDGVFRFGQGRKSASLPITSRVRFDINVTHTNDVRILFSNIVDARALGQVNLGGTISDLALTGHAEATRGTISYLDTVFKITSGTADFASFRGVLPYLDVEAETRVPEAVIQLGVTGVTDDLQLSLSSTPPLTEQEIVTKLTLPGRLTRLVQGGRDGMWEQELIRLFDDQLSSQVMGGIEMMVREALQLDEFRIRRAFTEENVQLQFGKYLVDNLYVTYTRTLDPDPLEYLGFEYRIKPNITVNNSINSDGEVWFGLETKLRF